MPSLDRFCAFVESEILSTPGNSLDRLKILINHLNIATIELPAVGSPEPPEAADVALAFYVLGRFDPDGSFAPLGDVVLPWCRQQPRELGAPVGGPEPGGTARLLPVSSARHDQRHIDVEMLSAVESSWPSCRGEGHGRLYESVEQWWRSLTFRLDQPDSTGIQLELPWPGRDWYAHCHVARHGHRTLFLSRERNDDWQRLSEPARRSPVDRCGGCSWTGGCRQPRGAWGSGVPRP